MDGNKSGLENKISYDTRRSKEKPRGLLKRLVRLIHIKCFGAKTFKEQTFFPCYCF